MSNLNSVQIRISVICKSYWLYDGKVQAKDRTRRLNIDDQKMKPAEWVSDVKSIALKWLRHIVELFEPASPEASAIPAVATM